MPRPRKRRRVNVMEIEALLADGLPVELDDLFEFVRQVNPSRLECPPDQREVRYQLKARLQSRVLRDFPTAVTVVRTRRAGVVGIRRQGRRGDACHAIVSRLDPDVRAVVLAMLGNGTE